MKKITTEKILSVYNLISDAKLTKMEDCDKFKMIKIIRALKLVVTNFEDFKKVAKDKLKGDNHDYMLEKAQQWQAEGEKTTLSEAERIEINKYFNDYNNKIVECLKEEAVKENELDFEPLDEEAFGKLVASNDWTLGQIAAIEEFII